MSMTTPCLSKFATAEGFKSIRPVIEVRGICQKCN